MSDLQNFDRVDVCVFRSAQPTQIGLSKLKEMGFKSVLNLRNDPLEFEGAECDRLDLFYFNAKLSGMQTPHPETVRQLLDYVEACPKPVLIHCQFGCDRTGLIVACHRIRFSGWTADQAIAEAKDYGLSPLLPNFTAFIREFERAASR